jgi:hypothetical protein
MAFGLIGGYQRCWLRPEDRSDKFLRNVRKNLQDRSVSQPRRPRKLYYIIVSLFLVVFGGVMVSVLATRHKVRGFNPGRGR